MPLSVLQRVERRRRRRARPLPAVLALLAVASLVYGGMRVRQGEEEAAGALGPAVAKPRALASARQTRPRVLPLLVGRPAGHRFRPALHARSAVLVDASTGRILWARHAHVIRPIASTTKIMTAVLALESLDPNDIVTVDRAAPRAALIREGLRAGERVPAWKLLYGLMLFSGNDDALALGVAAAGSRSAFVELMNEKAKELGLRHTHFRSPSGVIDRDNRSTAWDIAALARYAMRNPRFRAIVRTRIKRVSWAAPTYAKVYVNKNPLLGRYRGADGVKTGWTTLAGHCLVGSAQRGDRRLIAVLLGSTDAYLDARRLLDYGFRTA
jgi:serine-type D-Ala-D-Ala carboxypeptidase (penicillin-binding protein 5/6)